MKSHFEKAYRKVALPLTKFVVKRTGGDQEAVEEVLSRTLLAAWKGYESFKHKSTFFTWICKIALYKIADYYREQVNERSTFVTPLLQTISIHAEHKLTSLEKLALEDLKDGVKDCLKLLPEDKKRLLYLKYWKELTHKQIARVLGISERAVEGRLYRARNQMAQAISVSHPELLAEKQ